MSEPLALKLAVVGAGPVGLTLALHAARAMPDAQVTLFDARSPEADLSGDPRTIALTLGSVQLMQRLHGWPAEAAQPIVEVHVSQQPPSLVGALGGLLGEPVVRLCAAAEGVPMLGAVLGYGDIVAPLQRAWTQACEREPQRLVCRFGVPVTTLKPLPAGVEVDAAVCEDFDLAVVAEGGVRRDPVRRGVAHNYRQTAWVGTVTLQGARPGVAFERFTRHGPVALLPRRNGEAALVWCVSSLEDDTAALDDTQRLAVLNTMFHSETGRLVGISSLKPFPLGLHAERTLTQGRIVRIGNAAQTLHPVAGQGLNLGLRNAFELVRALARWRERPRDATASTLDAALRRLEWARGPDRWAMIAATDFLARSFTWQLPGLGMARGLGLAALRASKPLQSALARQMMYGTR